MVASGVAVLYPPVIPNTLVYIHLLYVHAYEWSYHYMNMLTDLYVKFTIKQIIRYEINRHFILTGSL